MPVAAGAVLNVASGILVALLGAALLLTNPRKDWNRVFGLFSVFWGGQIVALNAVRLLGEEPAAFFAGRLGLAFLIPLYFFVALFADLYPRPRPPFGTSAAAVAALVLPAAGALAVLFAYPRGLVEAIEPAGSGYTMRWGPLFPWFVTAPFFGAFFYALLVMFRRLREATSDTERAQVSFVLAALTLFAAYAVPTQLWLFGGAALGLDTAAEAHQAESILFALIMLGGLVVLVSLLVDAARRWSGGAAEHTEAKRVLATAGLALGAAAASILAGEFAATDLELLGLVRLGTVALIVYAIARYQLFDLDLHVKTFAAIATAAVAGGALAAAAWIALRETDASTVAGVGAAGLVLVIAFYPLLRAARAVADRVAPRVRRDGDHLYLRKLDVYRASLEGLLDRGRHARSDDPWLADLRGRLGLTERDHGVAVTLATGTVSDLGPGEVAFGKYEVDSVLAQGGFGRVFLARDRLLGRAVVIKELLAKWRGDPTVARTFLREAQIAGQLNHPHIVTVHAVEQRGADYYVVMEHVPGGTLQDRLDASTRLAQHEALRVARELLDALGAAHARGIVHRDLKPANVLFGARGEVKLADFGIAQLGEPDMQHTISGLTRNGAAPGTLQWMSPEQARGRPLDARSDLYAVAALLYRMLAGRPHVAVDAADELSARNAVASAAPPPAPDGVPASLYSVIARGLANASEDRYASAAEFLAALETGEAPHNR